MPETFIIDSQEAFEQYVHQILVDCDLDKPHFSFPPAEFKNWPVIHFNVKGGEKYQSTVTTYLIDGLKEFTDEIFRAICVVKYGKPDLRYLKERDRSQFDVVIKIAEGSSDGEGTAENIANSFFTHMNSTLSSMNGWKQLAAFVTYIGVLGGTVSFLGHQYFQTQSEETKAQVAIAEKLSAAQVEIANTLSNNTKEMMANQAEAFVEMNRQQNETLQALFSAHDGRTEFSEELEKRGELASENFMRQIAKDPSVTEAKVQHTSAKGEALEQYKQRATTEKSVDNKADDFYIKGVERVGTLGDTLSITAERADGILFNLKVKVDKLQKFEKDILTNELVIAENQRQTIRLAYKETLRNGKKSGAGELISVTYKEIR